MSPADVASVSQQLLLGLTGEKSFEEKLDEHVELTGLSMSSDVGAGSMQRSSRSVGMETNHTPLK